MHTFSGYCLFSSRSSEHDTILLFMETLDEQAGDSGDTKEVFTGPSRNFLRKRITCANFNLIHKFDKLL